MDYAVVWQHVVSSPWWCVWVLLPIILINVTLARLKYKLPDDGRRPKHVGAILI
jgi:hypothetical protein